MRFHSLSFDARRAILCVLACGSLLTGMLRAQAAKGTPTANAPIANFTDIAEKAGLTAPNIFGGIDTKKYIIETTGNGVAIFDYDNDGWPDIFLVNGTTTGRFSGATRSDQPALSQQSRWHVYRCNCEGRALGDGLGTRRMRRRLRQRWMGRFIRHLLRQEPALPQQSRGLYRGRGKGRRSRFRKSLGNRMCVRRLRSRWPS